MTASTPIRHLPETGSTNKDARDAFETEGVREPLWILTDRQTAGTGRRGRTWHQGEGNFAGTLLWPISADALKIPSVFSFIAGLAVAETVAESGIVPDRLSLKWPNDVLLDGRKLAGILSELSTAGEKQAILIGIGVNLWDVPTDAPEEAIALSKSSGGAPSARHFAERLDGHFRHFWSLFEAQGFSAIRQAWLSRAAGIGQPLTVRRHDTTQDGHFRGIDEDGALLLETEQGVERITAGDVFLGAGNV